MRLGAADSSAQVCPAPPAPPARQATPGFRVPRERAFGASPAHLDLRDPLASAMRGVRDLLGPLDPLVPQDPLPFRALTGKPSVFLAPQVHLGPLGPLEPWAPPLG